jgi:hypothetical protein
MQALIWPIRFVCITLYPACFSILAVPDKISGSSSTTKIKLSAFMVVSFEAKNQDIEQYYFLSETYQPLYQD